MGKYYARKSFSNNSGEGRTPMVESEERSTVEKIIRWHHDRNLIDGSTDIDQKMKLVQEVGELSDSVCKGLDRRDDVGDILVVLINIVERNGEEMDKVFDSEHLEPGQIRYMSTKSLVLELASAVVEDKLIFWYAFKIVYLLKEIARRQKFTLEDAMAHAYDEIKYRKGTMIDGVFVKDGN